jgi:hypothetical protein
MNVRVSRFLKASAMYALFFTGIAIFAGALWLMALPLKYVFHEYGSVWGLLVSAILAIFCIALNLRMSRHRH